MQSAILSRQVEADSFGVSSRVIPQHMVAHGQGLTPSRPRRVSDGGEADWDDYRPAQGKFGLALHSASSCDGVGYRLNGGSD